MSLRALQLAPPFEGNVCIGRKQSGKSPICRATPAPQHRHQNRRDLTTRLPAPSRCCRCSRPWWTAMTSTNCTWPRWGQRQQNKQRGRRHRSRTCPFAVLCLPACLFSAPLSLARINRARWSHTLASAGRPQPWAPGTPRKAKGSAEPQRIEYN